MAKKSKITPTSKIKPVIKGLLYVLLPLAG
jgi:hypothetical protein